MIAIYAELVKKQREFFLAGNTRSLSFRQRQLDLLERLISENEGQILAALKADLGKSEVEGYLTEVGFVLNELRYLRKRLKRLMKPKPVPTPLAYVGSRSRIIPEPYGVVLIISPWNYPFQLTIAPLVGAIAAGNCAVIKPSRNSAHTTALLAELINSAFPSEYVTVVTGEAGGTRAILQEEFDYIFFTGSTGVGKVVMEAAAKHLTPVTLELGGKSPCIVEPDADLKQAAKRIAWGKFLNAGQTCVAPDYMLVHVDAKDELMGEMKKALAGFYGSEPKTSADFGRIINQSQFRRLAGLLAEGTVVYGGETDPDKLYISPTIITDVLPDGQLMQDEIFGPILPVLTYRELPEAVKHINRLPKPLALYLFSRSKDKIEYVLSSTSSGGVCVNDTISHITTKWLPFGGVGASGMGKYHGRATFDTFTHYKSVLLSSTVFDVKQKYPPYKTPLSVVRKLMRFL